MIKGSVLQEDIAILTVYAPNNRAPKYMRQNVMGPQGEIDERTTTGGDSNIPLPEMDRPSRQKISEDTVELNSTINQLDVIDI